MPPIRSAGRCRSFASIRAGVGSGSSRKSKSESNPTGLALTPNGTKLYVTNSRSNSVSVIDTAIRSGHRPPSRTSGFEPRGLAITNDDDGDDADETVYVTQFLSLPVAGKVDGQDDAKVGQVTVISTDSDNIVGEVRSIRWPTQDSRHWGTRSRRIPPGMAPNFNFPTGAYPNQLNNIGDQGQVSPSFPTSARRRMARSASTSTRTACSQRD